MQWEVRQSSLLVIATLEWHTSHDSLVLLWLVVTTSSVKACSKCKQKKHVFYTLAKGIHISFVVLALSETTRGHIICLLAQTIDINCN